MTQSTSSAEQQQNNKRTRDQESDEIVVTKVAKKELLASDDSIPDIYPKVMCERSLAHVRAVAFEYEQFLKIQSPKQFRAEMPIKDFERDIKRNWLNSRRGSDTYMADAMLVIGKFAKSPAIFFAEALGEAMRTRQVVDTTAVVRILAPRSEVDLKNIAKKYDLREKTKLVEEVNFAMGGGDPYKLSKLVLNPHHTSQERYTDTRKKKFDDDLKRKKRSSALP